MSVSQSISYDYTCQNYKQVNRDECLTNIMDIDECLQKSWERMVNPLRIHIYHYNTQCYKIPGTNNIVSWLNSTFLIVYAYNIKYIINSAYSWSILPLKSF